MIRQTMTQRGITRAQAKDVIKKFDEEMLIRFVIEKNKRQQEQHVGLNRVKPIVRNAYRGMGYDT